MAAAFVSLSTPPLSSSIFRLRCTYHSQGTHKISFPSSSLLSLTAGLSGEAIQFSNPINRNHYRRSSQLWRTSAGSEEVLSSDSNMLENSQEIITTSGGDEGVAVIIQVLLFAAFFALSILTIGVIYIGVQDFLQKREREKFEKEQAEKKKSGKKKRVKARAGPRGFGQKIDEDEFD